MIDQLNFSNMSVVNLNEQMTAMRNEIDSLRMENSRLRLNSALEDERTNNAAPPSCSTPNGVHAYQAIERRGSEILGHDEQRSVISATNIPFGNGRGDDSFSRAMRNDNEGNSIQFSAPHSMFNDYSTARNCNVPERSVGGVRNTWPTAEMRYRTSRDNCYEGSDHRLTVSEVESAFSEFSGTDHYPVHKWIYDFEEMAETIGLTDLRKFVVAKRKLVGLAKMSLNSAHHVTNWWSLRDFLIDEFVHRENSALVHERLRARKRHLGENVLEYFLVMREIGAKAQIDSESIITYTINGINDNGPDKMLLYGANSVSAFRDKLRIYQGIKDSKYNRDSRLTPTNIEKRYGNSRSEGVYKPRSPNRFNSVPKSTACYSCGKVGHLARECPRRFGERQVNVCKSSTVSKGTYMTVILNDCLVEAFFDSGADVSLLREDWANKLNLIVDETEKKRLTTLNGTIWTLGTARVDVQIEHTPLCIVFDILAEVDMPQSVIIGRNLLMYGDVSVTAEGAKFHPKEENFALRITTDEIQDDPLKHINDVEIRDKVKNLIENYTPHQNAETRVKLKIVLKNDSPIQQLPRRLAPLEKQIVDEQIANWLEEGIIRSSTSEYSSPIVLAHKKDGTRRLCVDYRKLNKLIVRDHFPIPLIEDIIDDLHSARVFSTLDLENGFFHVPVDEASIKFTAFVTPCGQYEFLKTPFGLSISPTVFQRFINDIFRELIERKIVIIYIDDLLILAKDEKEALERLKMVLEIAAKHGLKIKWKKCQLLKTKIEHLGHVIDNGVIRPTPDKTLAVYNFREPTNFKEIQQFLGLTGYFRKFVEGYSIIAKPIPIYYEKKWYFHLVQRKEMP